MTSIDAFSASVDESIDAATADDGAARASAEGLLHEWLIDFEKALAAANPARVAELFVPEGHLRDLLVFTGDLRTFSGAAEIGQVCGAAGTGTAPNDVGVADLSAMNFQIQRSTPPRHTDLLGTPTVEGMFTFETAIGRCRGHVRLTARAGSTRWRAWTLLTYLTELAGHEESRAGQLLRGASAVRRFGDQNWFDVREEARANAMREPTVLIVGGGQNGLALAARLNQLNVDNLVVDPMKRVGDNWRNRYHALVLHNETPANHLPYMPFPENWPTYLAKDQVANWLEAYAEAQEINVKTETRFVGATYDDATERWSATVRSTDGGEEVIRVRHVVMATGIAGIPHMPEIPGLDNFAGDVVHSSRYNDGARYRDRRVVVIGTGNSAHDVAQDLHGHRAHVTMVQRGATTVVSVDPSARLNAELYMSGLPTEDADTIAASIPYPLQLRANQAMTKRSIELDADLLAGLASVGFRTDWGHDDTGWVMKYRRKHGGYYLNVGCSDLLVNKQIGLVQYDDMVKIEPEGVRMRDGSLLPADLIVLGTGYTGQQRHIAQLFDEEIAGRVGDVWGLDAEGELRNLWRKTGQPRLWFMAGSLLQCRFYSRVLALQIKADEESIRLA